LIVEAVVDSEAAFSEVSVVEIEVTLVDRELMPVEVDVDSDDTLMVVVLSVVDSELMPVEVEVDRELIPVEVVVDSVLRQVLIATASLE
jgi:pilus assembly protein FimV